MKKLRKGVIIEESNVVVFLTIDFFNKNIIFNIFYSFKIKKKNIFNIIQH